MILRGVSCGMNLFWSRMYRNLAGKPQCHWAGCFPVVFQSSAVCFSSSTQPGQHRACVVHAYHSTVCKKVWEHCPGSPWHSCVFAKAHCWLPALSIWPCLSTGAWDQGTQFSQCSRPVPHAHLDCPWFSRGTYTFLALFTFHPALGHRSFFKKEFKNFLFNIAYILESAGIP